MNTILLTGFKPFGPYRVNVAEMLVDQLNGQILEIDQDVRVQIVGVKLPMNFRVFRQTLAQAIIKVKPKLVIGLGMDFKDLAHLSFELVAHRRPKYGTRIPDEEGNFGVNQDLDKLSETLRLPNESQIKSIIKTVKGIELSEDAGGYMCETVLRDLI